MAFLQPCCKLPDRAVKAWGGRPQAVAAGWVNSLGRWGQGWWLAAGWLAGRWLRVGERSPQAHCWGCPRGWAVRVERLALLPGSWLDWGMSPGRALGW